MTLPLNVELDDGLLGQFGSVHIEDKSTGKIWITISIDPNTLGDDADLHEFYFNLDDDLDIDKLVLSHEKCMQAGDDDFERCETDFELEKNPSVRGGAGAEFDYGVNFGNGGGEKGNGQLVAAIFKLVAFEEDDDHKRKHDDDDHEHKGKRDDDDDHKGDHDDDDKEQVELRIKDLLESSETRSGIEIFFAAHVQDTDLVQGEDSETVGALVPEPGTAALLGLGLLGIAVAGRRRS